MICSSHQESVVMLVTHSAPCYVCTPRSSHNCSAEKNVSRLSTVSVRSRDRSASFERRKTVTRGRPVAPRPSSHSRSRSRERSQTDKISQNLSHLRMMSPASGTLPVSCCWFSCEEKHVKLAVIICPI